MSLIGEVRKFNREFMVGKRYRIRAKTEFHTASFLEQGAEVIVKCCRGNGYVDVRLANNPDYPPAYYETISASHLEPI